MTYELAVKLKKAGFRQGSFNSVHYEIRPDEINTHIPNCLDAHVAIPYYSPTCPNSLKRAEQSLRAYGAMSITGLQIVWDQNYRMTRETNIVVMLGAVGKQKKEKLPKKRWQNFGLL